MEFESTNNEGREGVKEGERAGNWNLQTVEEMEANINHVMNSTMEAIY
jgi:hypothetical protein